MSKFVKALFFKYFFSYTFTLSLLDLRNCPKVIKTKKMVFFTFFSLYQIFVCDWFMVLRYIADKISLFSARYGIIHVIFSCM